MDPKPNSPAATSNQKPRRMHRLRGLIHKDRMSGNEGAPPTEPKPKTSKHASQQVPSRQILQSVVQQQQQQIQQIQQRPVTAKPPSYEDKRSIYMDMFQNIRSANMMNLKQNPVLGYALDPAEVPDFIDFSEDDLYNSNPPPFHQFNPSATPFVPNVPFNTTNPNSVGFQHPPFNPAPVSNMIPQQNLYIAGGFYQPQYDAQQFTPAGPTYINDQNAPLHPYYASGPQPQPQYQQPYQQWQQQPSPQPTISYLPLQEDVWRPTPFTQASPANPTPMTNLKRSRDEPKPAPVNLSPLSEIERFREAFPAEPSGLRKAGPAPSVSAPLAITFKPTYELPADFVPDPSPNAPVYVSPRQQRGSPKQARSSPQAVRQPQSKRRNSRSSPRESRRRPSQQWVPKQQSTVSSPVDETRSPAPAVIPLSSAVEPVPTIAVTPSQPADDVPIVDLTEIVPDHEEQAVPSPISQKIHNPSAAASRRSYLASPALGGSVFVSSPVAYRTFQPSPAMPEAKFVASPVSMRVEHEQEVKLSTSSPKLQQQTFSSPQLKAENSWDDASSSAEIPPVSLTDLPPPSSLPAPPTPRIQSELDVPLLGESSSLPAAPQNMVPAEENDMPEMNTVMSFADVTASLPLTAEEPVYEILGLAPEAPTIGEEPAAAAPPPPPAPPALPTSIKTDTDSQGTFMDGQPVSLLLSDIRKGAHLRHIEAPDEASHQGLTTTHKDASKAVLETSIASAIASRRTFIEEDEDEDTESWSEW